MPALPQPTQNQVKTKKIQKGEMAVWGVAEAAGNRSEPAKTVKQKFIWAASGAGRVMHGITGGNRRRPRKNESFTC